MEHFEIMCTLTGEQILHQPCLVDAMRRVGMSAVRINTAHLDSVEQLGQLAKALKNLDPALKVLIDTKGPEMRTTSNVGNCPIRLVAGEHVKIQGGGEQSHTDSGTIYVNFPHIHDWLKPGDRLLIDDGHLVLEVQAVDGSAIEAKVLTGGMLGSRKGFAVEGVDVDLPAVSQHDRMFIAYAAHSADVDVIAHSFVRGAADVLAVRAAMDGGTKPIIAKIENQQGIDNLAGIIDVSDGILIARGDLTASIGAENVPAAQQRIAAATKGAGLPLYLATNILPSLMGGAEPSDADIAGILLAMSQGVDVMLLTNETASGTNPILSVAALAACNG